MVAVILERQRCLLLHEAIYSFILGLRCDLVVVAGEGLAAEGTKPPLPTILLVPTLDLTVDCLWKEIAFDALSRLSAISFHRVCDLVDLNAASHVGEAS